MHLKTLFIAITCFTITLTVHAQIKLAADIESGAISEGSFPQYFTESNGILFFQAQTSSQGIELWKTDGTTSGTALVKDIRPGNSHSAPQNLTDANGVLFFTADDGIHGIELWKTDGTLEGTAIVADIADGSQSSSPSHLVNLNGTVFFVAHDGAHDFELWKSDGTEAGTVMVKDIDLTDISKDILNPYNLAVSSNLVFFIGTNGTNGDELWAK